VPESHRLAADLTAAPGRGETYREQQEFLFTPGGDPSPLGVGFLLYEHDGDRWAVAMDWRCEFELEITTPGDRELSFLVSARNLRAAGTMRLYANGRKVGTIRPERGRRWISLLIPARRLRIGRNRFALEYLGENGKPLTGKEIPARERLRFHGLRLTPPGSPPRPAPPPPSFDQGWLRLPPRTLFCYARALPAETLLELEWRSANGKGRPRVEVFSNAGESRIWTPGLLGRSQGRRVIRLTEDQADRVCLYIEPAGGDDEDPPGVEVRARIYQPSLPEPPTPAPRWAPAGTRPPNIVLIVWDATHACRFGCYGDPAGHTPVADRLSRRATTYASAHASSPYTLSSVATLFSGRYPEEHRVLLVGDRLYSGIPTVTELLRDAGYATIMVTAMPLASSVTGVDRGFETLIETFRLSRREMEADRVVERLLTVLPADDRRPFFLYLHFREPHSPYTPPEPYRDFFKRHPDEGNDDWGREDHVAQIDRVDGLPRLQLEHIQDLYDGNIRTVDAQLQRVLDALAERGLLERTVLLLTADHGEAFGEHGRLGHNTTLFDEMTHVPLIVRTPGELRARVQPALVGIIDFAPTLAAIAGIPRPPAALWRGQPFPRDGEPSGERAIHLVSYAVGAPLRGLRTPRHLFLHPWGNHQERLFDLDTDPAELHDIAEKYPATRTVLRQKDEELVRHGAAQAPTPPPAPQQALDDETVERLRYLGYIE
jgi:arylsulfatase